jgi:uncharacterized membrane protein (DUF2068 family)
MNSASTTTTPPKAAPARHDRLLPWIAAERALRALLLVALGIALVSHPYANWAKDISDLARHLGLNPSGNGIHRLLDQIRRISPHRYVLFGIVALAYGALEGAEAYGLFKRRRWGEWLTVIATSLLLIPELWEISRSATPLKVGGLLVNLLIVAYLLWRIRRADRRVDTRAETIERPASTALAREQVDGSLAKPPPFM